MARLNPLPWLHAGIPPRKPRSPGRVSVGQSPSRPFPFHMSSPGTTGNPGWMDARNSRWAPGCRTWADSARTGVQGRGDHIDRGIEARPLPPLSKPTHKRCPFLFRPVPRALHVIMDSFANRALRQGHRPLEESPCRKRGRGKRTRKRHGICPQIVASRFPGLIPERGPRRNTRARDPPMGRHVPAPWDSRGKNVRCRKTTRFNKHINHPNDPPPRPCPRVLRQGRH